MTHHPTKWPVHNLGQPNKAVIILRCAALINHWTLVCPSQLTALAGFLFWKTLPSLQEWHMIACIDFTHECSYSCTGNPLMNRVSREISTHTRASYCLKLNHRQSVSSAELRQMMRHKCHPIIYIVNSFWQGHGPSGAIWDTEGKIQPLYELSAAHASQRASQESQSNPWVWMGTGSARLTPSRRASLHCLPFTTRLKVLRPPSLCH